MDSMKFLLNSKLQFLRIISAFKIQLIIRLLITLVSQISDLYFKLSIFHKDIIFLKVEALSFRSIELNHKKLCEVPFFLSLNNFDPKMYLDQDLLFEKKTFYNLKKRHQKWIWKKKN